MVLYLLYIIFIFYISIYINNRAQEDFATMLQCYNATLFSTRRKGLSRQRNPLPTRTSARITAKPSQQISLEKMSPHPRFSVCVDAKKIDFSPPKHPFLTEHTPPVDGFQTPFDYQKKHFFWRVKQRQNPVFCPVFDTQNRKIAKKRCRFSVNK